MDSFIMREEDYAIRTVIFLATVGRMVKTKEICTSLYLSKPIVAKIVSKLKAGGLVITKTGKEGGLTISDEAYDATIYDVLVCMGFNSRMNQCLAPNIGCQLMPICKVNRLFCDMQQDIEKRLKSAKIKDFLYKDRDQTLINIKQTQEV